MSRRAFLCRCGRRDRYPVAVKGVMLCSICAEDEGGLVIPPKRPERPDFRYTPVTVRRIG